VPNFAQAQACHLCAGERGRSIALVLQAQADSGRLWMAKPRPGAWRRGWARLTSWFGGSR
jgi:hypothetical protein